MSQNMTSKGFADYVRFRTKTDANTFSDANIMLLANAARVEVAMAVVAADEDLLGWIGRTNLVADQREYPLPIDLLKIKYAEVILDGINQIHIDELDLSQYQRSTDEATIISQFANAPGAAFVDYFRGSAWLYSGTITNVSQGAIWHGIKLPGKIVDLSDDTRDLAEDVTIDSVVYAGMPVQMHTIWAEAVVNLYKGSGDVPGRAGVQMRIADKNGWLQDVSRAVAAIKNLNLDRAFVPAKPIKESNFNNGWNL